MSLLPWFFRVLIDNHTINTFARLNVFTNMKLNSMLNMEIILSVFNIMLFFFLLMEFFFFNGKSDLEWSTLKFEICYLAYVPRGLRTIN